ncbi:MAG TPA: DNA-binding response regulator, partial [Flavobacteriaceae bacterium]|nr:DNA-binding response regulator [Flavobacteriaceae bacterium]
ISFNTVETHRKRIFQKVQIKNSIGLIRFAIKHNLID